MSEQSALTGVEVFAAGTHRGRAYTTRDLDDMVANFERNSAGPSPRLRVPAVLGHDEDQIALRGSGLPAAAWCRRLYRQGGKLLADFGDVPEKVMRLLRGRVYRTVSAEVYDAPPAGTSGSGKMLRRVAFLGGDIPQVKSLDDIPVPDSYAERFDAGPPAVVKFRDWRRLPDGAYAVFSEVMPMTTTAEKFEQDPGQKAMWAKADATGSIGKSGRYSAKKLRTRSRRMRAEGNKYFDESGQPIGADAMLASLAEMGADTEALRGLPETALAEILRLVDGQAGDDEEQPPADDMADDGEELPEPRDDAERAAFAERARRMMDRARRYVEKYAADDADADGGKDQDDENKDKPGMFSEKAIASLVEKAVEAAISGRVKGDIEQLKKFSEEETAARKRAAIEAFCESRLKEGKILPAELDGKNPANLKDRLYRADGRAVVRKFRENGKEVALTELDLQMREIDARPAFKFGERFRSPEGGGSAEDADVARLEEHYETFSEQLTRHGVTKEKLVEAFKAEKKRRPHLTADDYLRRN